MSYWLVRIGYAMFAANLITLGMFITLVFNIKNITQRKETLGLLVCYVSYVLVFVLFFNHFK